MVAGEAVELADRLGHGSGGGSNTSTFLGLSVAIERQLGGSSNHRCWGRRGGKE